MPRVRLLILAKRMDSNEMNPKVDYVFLSQDEYGKGVIQKEDEHEYKNYMQVTQNWERYM